MILEKIRWRFWVSLFLIFHLFGVLIGPNPNSFLGQSVAPVYRPYLNFFGLGSTWSFFAPEPFYHPIYIDYVLNLKGKMPLSGRFPEEKSPYWMRDRQNRRMGLARIILSSDDNVRNMFVHYLCREHPDLESANLWRVLATEPSLEMVQKGQKKITDPADFKIEVLGTYFCPEASS